MWLVKMAVKSKVMIFFLYHGWDLEQLINIMNKGIHITV